MINDKPFSDYHYSGIARELIVADFSTDSNSQNGKNLNLLAVDENDQNSNPAIHSYREIELLATGNTSADNPFLQVNAINFSLHNSSAINVGGAAS